MSRTSSLFATIAAAVLLTATQVAAAEPEPGLWLEYATPPGTSDEDMDQAASVLRERLWGLGIGGSVTDGGDAIVVSFASAITSSDEAEALAARLAMPGDVWFVPVERRCAGEVEAGAPAPACLMATEPLFDGTGVYDASVGVDPQTGEVTLQVELDREAGDIFDAHAEAHFLEHFAVVIDGIVESAPRINATRFGGQATISGDFTDEEAAGLAAALRSGALPVALELREVRFEEVMPSEVERPTEPPSFRTEGLESGALYIARSLGGFGVDDFVAVLEPEDGHVTLTILSDDPALPGLVAEMLGDTLASAPVTIAYDAGPAAAFLQTVPTRPVPLELMEAVPDEMAWLPEQGAIVGDAASLEPQAAPGQGQVDIELARERVAELHAAAEAWDAVMQLPGYGGLTVEYDETALCGDDYESFEDIPGVLVVGFKGGEPAGALDRLRTHIETLAWSSGIEAITGDDVEFSWAELESMEETIGEIAAEHGVEAQTAILYQSINGYQCDIGSGVSKEPGPLDQWISIWPPAEGGVDEEAWESFKVAVKERLPEGALPPPSDWMW